MKIYSWNVNGLRSVYKKGFLEWFKQEKADIVCLQEIKLQEEQIPEELRVIKGYTAYYNTGTRKGYAGVAVYTKQIPRKVSTTLGMERFDCEGRFLRLDYDDFIVIALYIPQGARDKRNLTYKLEVYDTLLVYLKKLKGKNVIVIGDLNIAHTELDLARPKQNTKNIMFTPEEREKLDALEKLGFVDTFRTENKEGGNYSWWPYFANARERNLGWRIDYVFVSKMFATRVKKAFILPSVRGSDHCPVGIMVKK
ncbi:MAG: Exodeoxyribonuclease III Xth [Candidatus Wolfebacteria bacterium GW2011_GWC2_39_22]|uniref:Exodeoxyribonuclease III Xth n=1 Tax=Candidatus Wolfebacteria bacterium GW2011_GWC2_39_22 TaxID=1619013 RepID=A0A0G0RH43_9BACT|nr:MAG: Exodeoxyribonuclease III Xth [Candidatus Wolfebacteria bacterium GW2011_GWC2_39_22]HBI25355.1 exodeoxyribonuclease III [Candidatus Wolfebacteria bacterium]